MEETTVPHRWDASSVEIIRRFGRGLRSLLPRERGEELLRAAARVLAAAGDADLLFVGRSPESLHDFLQGALAATRFRERLRVFQLSLRDHPLLIRHERPGSIERLERYFEAVGLAPRALAARERPVAFVDLVCTGQTFGNLAQALRFFARRAGVPWRSVQSKLRWICVVSRGEVGFSGWEPSDSRWTRHFSKEQVRLVEIPWRFWDFLGNEQAKTTRSYSVDVWGEKVPWPELDDFRGEAVRFARAVFRFGECSRRRLAKRLEQHANARGAELWLRGLLRELSEGYALLT